METLPFEKTLPQTGELRSASLKNTALQLLKFALAIGMVVYLIVRGDIAWEPLRASLSLWRYSIPAFLLLALTPLGQLWRWQSLLRATGLVLPYRDVLSYIMVSKFFNMAFPGHFSGDILRGFYVSRRALGEGGPNHEDPGNPAPTGPSAIVASIVFDRVAGVLPLFIWSLLGLLGSANAEMASMLGAYIGALAGLGLLGAAGLFLLAYRQPQPPSPLLRISGWFRLQKPFCAFYQGAHYYVRDLRLIRNIVGISFINHGLTIASFVLFGLALGIQRPLANYLMLVPWGLMLTAVPVAPSGLGVGQVAFLALFGLVGASQGANLFTLYLASHVVINLAGAVLYPFLQTTAPSLPSSRPAPAEKQ